jgi:allantoinase
MPDFDLVIRGGTLVTHSGVRRADLGITGGKIAQIAPELPNRASETMDAAGLHIFPGVIDSHVHFNEPGRAHWEGFETGSRALAAGGGTLFFDMPLNAHPPTIDAAAFDKKSAAAQATSLVDFAFWGGLLPGNLDQLEELADRGVIGFKAFMCNSGIEDFPCVDDELLREGMKRAARLGKVVAVHAESEAITADLTAQNLAEGKISIRDYLDSRPIHAELDAIQRALEMAGETGCALHIVHVSCGAGITLIASARQQGVNVSCETCPHYLALTEDYLLQIGALAKCAPPLRPKSAQDALWEHLRNDLITTIGSDHSPSPPEMRTDKNFFKVWGGISSIQHMLPLLITERHVKGEMALPLLSRLLSFNVAATFNLPPHKGRIEMGADADLALVDLKDSFTIKSEDLFYRHPQTPYAGRTLTGKVVQTILRGRTVFKDGKIVSKPIGRLVKPVS